ncbi:MAG: heme exporter protein CcmD [Pseudomonadota bacterium]
MIPDLGKYASEVLSAYAVSFLLLVLIVAVSVKRSMTVRNRLRAFEARRKKR